MLAQVALGQGQHQNNERQQVKSVGRRAGGDAGMGKQTNERFVGIQGRSEGSNRVMEEGKNEVKRNENGEKEGE